MLFSSLYSYSLMKLVIVESPNKTVTIGKLLGKDYKVVASIGHIRDLSTKGKGGLGIDIDAGFKPDWIISKDKRATVASLIKEAKNSDGVILATDPDREGEAISWHLAQVLHLPVETATRWRFHEITRDGIYEAANNPSTIDMRLVKAQETRRMEDRIIGFKVSMLLQKKAGVKSAGRVQSSTLRIIVDRQKEIDSFVPEEYWTIDCLVEIEGKTYKAVLTKVDGKPFKCRNKEEADAIISRIGPSLKIASITKEKKNINPPLPLTTSSMQQVAYTKFKFSNKRTQDTAQHLYEGMTIDDEHVGLITYMRTDSTRISPLFFNKHAVPYIKEKYGDDYVGTLRAQKSNENVQDAHEAIRPTGTHRTPEEVSKYVTADEAKLYRLIYCRSMASLMAPKKAEKTTLTLTCNGLEFSLNGSVTLFKGFEAIYGEFEDEEDEDTLPLTKEGDELKVAKINSEQKFTKPEPPYNEASIVKAMEKYGIGRPSTYASTIETLLKRKYVTATKGVLTPTEDGIKSVAILSKYFPDVVSITYSKEMEDVLDRVADGEETLLEAMNNFYTPFNEAFEEAKVKMYKDEVKPTGEMCPVCGRPLVYKKNKKGQEFVACSGFPECTYIKKDEKEETKVEYTGENCPECGSPLVYKMNKKGEKFIGCSSYPKCRYTASANGTPTKKAEKVIYTEKDYVKPCPKCKTGFLVVKKGKKAEFLGCTNFPKCRYHEWIEKKK